MNNDKKRAYVSQSDIPRHSLEEALRVPRAIFENYALGPTKPINVAAALEIQPGSSQFRSLTGAAIAYGLTTGGYNVEKIEVTALGKQIVAPTEEGADGAGKRIAIMQPRVAREFLEKYDGKPIPREDIAQNVLADLGVPRDAAPRVLQLILDNAKDVGILKVIKGATYVDLDAMLEPSGAGVEVAATQVSKGESRRNIGENQEVEEYLTTLVPSSTALVRRGSTEHSDTLRKGLQVDAYILKERIGAGFSAEVWSAEVSSPPIGVDLRAGKNVAVKFYHAHAMAIPDQVIRIEREFRIAQRIRHQNLIRIYEYVLASTRPFHNFLVMDIAKGQTLKALIPPTGLSAQKALQICRQILSALEELHGAGALHRDIKPGNIAVDDSPAGLKAVLLDLGIVSVMHEKSLTLATRFMGSKHWAPYEQLVGDPIDERSDLYSFGAVAYNLLTGDIPYGGKGTEAAIAVEMSRKPLRLPDSIQIDSPTRELINSCLSTDQKNRPISARFCLDSLSKSL